MTDMSGLRITYGPVSTHLTGTPEQIERVFTLAVEAAHANVNCQDPSLQHVNRLELDNLRAIHKEWF